MAYSRKALKGHYKRISQTPFQQGWEFRAEIIIPAENLLSGISVPDMSIFMKSFTHGGYTIDYESKRIGTAHLNSPTSKNAGSVSCTVRDNKSGDVETFFRKLQNVVNSDGTVNMPYEYLFKVLLYRPDNDGNEVLRHSWTVSAESMGEVARSYEQVSEFTTFELSFKKYRS